MEHILQITVKYFVTFTVNKLFQNVNMCIVLVLSKKSVYLPLLVTNSVCACLVLQFLILGFTIFTSVFVYYLAHPFIYFLLMISV